MMSASTKVPLNSPRSAVAAEAAARQNAIEYQAGRNLDAGDKGFAGGREESTLPGPGQPLGRRERAEMESRFQRDFSNVRVHTNSKEAEAMGARAFTRGNDIAFAPGESPATDRSLLAHELTHSAQQADGGARVQKDPKKGATAGIGSAPPSEAFTRAEKAGAEDEAVLFNVNEATLSAAGLAVVKKAAAGQRAAVTVEIHGYASSEGEGEYNVNLSAHRAAALKVELKALLPQGSQVTLFAHGETTGFGPAENNRRAGFKITPLVPPAAPKQSDENWSLDPAGDAPKRDVHLDPAASSVRLIPPLSLAPAPYTYQPPTVMPQVGGPAPIDWLVMRNKWAAYGLNLDARGAGDIEGYAATQHAATVGLFTTFFGFKPYAAGKLADKLQPIALGVATGAYLSNNYPSAGDLLDRDIKAAHPDSWKTPSIPLTDIADVIYQQATGKDNSYLTRF